MATPTPAEAARPQTAWPLDRLARLPARAGLAVTAALLVAGYALLHNRLHVHYLDDAWSMSFVWTWMHDGVAADRVYRADAALTFGYGQFVLYGALLQLLGWTKGNALLISTALMAGAAGCWYGICRAARWPREPAALMGLSLLLFYKCVEAANLARPDALVLCLLSTSLWLMTRHRALAAGLVAAAAVEVHPIGATTFFYLGAWLLYQPRSLMADPALRRALLTWAAVGLALGALLFYLSRPELLTLERLRTMSTSTVHGPPRTDFTWIDRHFRYHSHVEGGIFIAALALYLWRRLWRVDALPLLCLAGVLLAALLIRRPNGFYVLMAFPAFALLCARALADLRLLRLAFIALLLSFSLRAGLQYRQQRDYDFQATMDRVTEMIPADDLPVVGLDDFWFGLRQRRFVPANYAGSFQALALPAFYLLDSSVKPRALAAIRRQMGDAYDITPVAAFTDGGGQQVRLARCTR